MELRPGIQAVARCPHCYQDIHLWYSNQGHPLTDLGLRVHDVTCGQQ